MHILHLKDTLEVGGISAVLHTFLHTATHTHPHISHSVATFAPGPFAQNIRELGVPVDHLTTPGYRAVAAYVREHKPDVIHALGFTMQRHARLLHRLTGIPVVCGIHGDLNKIGRLQSPLQSVLLYFTGHWSSAYICVSDAVREILLQKLPRTFDPARVVRIYNGIAIETKSSCHSRSVENPVNDTGPWSSFRSSSYDGHASQGDKVAPSSPFIIGSVGRLAKEKSYDLLLRSAAPLCRDKKAVIYLVGDGPERHNLERLAIDLDIANEVIFHGEQRPATPWYQRFDCFVLSSQTEGLSIALLEALTAGLPAISTHHSATHEIITHNVNGLLVPHNDEEKLRESLMQIMHDAALRARLQKEAPNCAKKFGAERMTQKYMRLFTSLR